MTTQNNQYREGPIIKSLLDMDFYKFTMGQFAYHRYADVPVKYAFCNRTKNVKIADVVEEKDLRRELDHVMELKPANEEIKYLGQIKNNGGLLFKQDYLDFFTNTEMIGYNLKKVNGEFNFEVDGPWAKGIYWETLALSIMNELYYRALTKDMTDEQFNGILKEGKKRLEAKMDLFEQNPGATFTEFGTRRRFGREWQDYVVEYCKQRVPNQITGTSNVFLAMKHGLNPKGTMAHETFMIYSRLFGDSDCAIRGSHNKVLVDWWNEYGYDLSIALTDTYGTDFFFKDMTEQQAKDWKGLRQDSADPRQFAKREINFYEGKGINPRGKIFLPSDGLEARTIIDLHREFEGKILQNAGWGTSLTNDLGLKANSMVIKAVKANGRGTVKLSDNPAKKMGEQEDVVRFMKIFDYNPANYKLEECKY